MHYYFASLEAARDEHHFEFEAEALSELGVLFFETGRTKEAEKYIAMSNAVAEANNINITLLRNYMLLSTIERSRGNYMGALEQSEKYNRLNDSLFSANKLVDINQLQRINEISKTDRQIEQLAVEQRIKERTIGYQKVTIFIAFAALFLVVAILLFVFRQNKKLNRAYRALFAKNVENLELRDRGSHEHLSNTPYHDSDGTLLARIMVVMEDMAVICDPDFSIIKLALLVESNNTYVSQVINNTMHKNFRALLNEYRIREAQRLLSKSDAARYTIESISLQLGYKSPNTFRAAFQEITGVSPGFYLKSLRETTQEP